MNTNILIEKFNYQHKYRYDYSLVKYINSKTKVKIICKEHGIFEQGYNNHIYGTNCPKCGLNNQNEKQRYNIKLVLNQFKTVHGDLYDYSLVNYVNNKIKIKIICKEHGVFKQTPANHKKGSKCPKCSKMIRDTNIRKDIKLVLNQFKTVHGDLYDYSLVNYVNSHKKVKIICKEHGIFEQSSAHHSKGTGCPECKYINKYFGRPSILYYIKIYEQYKIGICLSKLTPEEDIKNRYRIELKKGLLIEIINYKYFENGEEAYIMEQKIKKFNKNKLIKKSDMILETGYTETFFKDIR